MLHHDLARGDLAHAAVGDGADHVPGVLRGARLHARGHQRRLGRDQRHGLPLHVRPHQGAVRVVMLQERNHGGGHAHDLLRRGVDELDVRHRRLVDLRAVAHRHAVGRELAVGLQRRVRLGDGELLFGVSGHVFDLIGDPRANRDLGVAVRGGQSRGGLGCDGLARRHQFLAAVRRLNRRGGGSTFERRGIGRRHALGHSPIGRFDESVGIHPWRRSPGY